MNKEPITISLDLVISKKGKTGKPYISVKSGDEWYSCWEKELFSILLDSKGKKLMVITEKNGDFTNIVDVMSDELGVIPTTPKTLPNDKEVALNLLKEINRKLDILINR